MVADILFPKIVIDELECDSRMCIVENVLILCALQFDLHIVYIF